MAKGDGTAWKNVKTTGFTGEIKKLYESYDDTIKTADEFAVKLREALKKEWRKKFPDGVDGKTAAFKISNGSVQYAMVNIKNEADTGDDIFSLSK